MEYKVYDECIIVRLDPSDELIKSLKEVALKECIEFAVITSGVGMVEGMSLSWFCVNNNDYDSFVLPGVYDLNSISGNISLLNDELCSHVHVQCNQPDFKAIGGHLLYAKAHITMELSLTIIKNSKIKRKTRSNRPASYISFD